jgi:hypothetical protein
MEPHHKADGAEDADRSSLGRLDHDIAAVAEREEGEINSKLFCKFRPHASAPCPCSEIGQPSIHPKMTADLERKARTESALSPSPPLPQKSIGAQQGTA